MTEIEYKLLAGASEVKGDAVPMEPRDIGTDLDASLRFVARWKHELRFVEGLGWLAYDGHRWKPGADNVALEKAKQSAREWLNSAVTMPAIGEAEGEKRRARIKSAILHENEPRIRAALKLAETGPSMRMDVEGLDSSHFLLNVLNGTLDLRTGTLRPHSRDDLITKLSPVRYDPAATHPALIRYLDTVERTRPGMVDFMARCYGAALTGDASTESLFLLQGDGGSGKTTLTEGIAAMLGDYSCKLPFESFCLSKNPRSGGAASPDLMALRGSRLAYASEGDQSARLDAGLVKTLTGNEPVTARALYGEFITFRQTWKLWLVSNYDPRADSEDTGIWRRMVKIPFAAIPQAERDPAIKRALTEDADARAALLAWAVRGCLDWQRRGLGRAGLAIPSSVESAIDEYRKRQDTLGQWFDDLLADGARLEDGGRTDVKCLRGHYDDWCRDGGYTPCLAHRFNTFLEGKGLKRTRGTGGRRRWEGIEVPSE